MELWEAVKLLNEDKKVRKQTWSKNEYIYLDNNTIKDEKGEIITTTSILFGAPISSWEEYKEGWQNVETIHMALVSAANCPYCNKQIVTLKMLYDCKYCPYCGKQVIK